MARISIEPVRAKETLTEQSELEKTLKELYQEVENVRTGLTYKIAGQEAIAARLCTATEQINKETVSTGAMRSGLMEVIARYEQTESGNLDRVGAEKTTVQGTINPSQFQMPNLTDLFGGAIQILGPGGYPGWLLGGLLGMPGKFMVSEGKVEPKNEATVDLEKVYKDKDGFFKKVSDFEDAHSEKDGVKFYYDPETKKIIEVNERDKDALAEFKKHNKGTIPVDVKMAGVGASGSISGWSLSGKTGSGGIVGAEGSVDLLKLEGNASAYVGMLGIGASAGASFTAFSAEERAYLGNEDLQIYEKIGVSAGKLEAKASASAGLVDKEGKFNPSAYVGASAEAIAGEVSGSVGVKALGTDVAVKGSLNYGIGAHANVGLHDGKISVDIGATLGVGASIKLDIDVSGTVEAIGDAVGNVASGVGAFIDWITPW